MTLMKRGFIDFEMKLIQDYTIIDIMDKDEEDGVYFCGNCPSCGRVCFANCGYCERKGRNGRTTVFYNKDKKIINPSLISILLIGEDSPGAERD